MIKSSVRYLGGGDRNTAIVSHIPLHDFRTFADPKQAPRITSATLNIEYVMLVMYAQKIYE